MIHESCSTDEKLMKPASMTDQTFLSGLFHEFYTPLTVIKEFVSILRDGMGGEISQKQKEFLEIVLRNSAKIEGLLHDLHNYSEIKLGGKLDLRVESLDANEMVREVLSGLALSIRTKALRVRFTPCRAPVPVSGDRKLLLRALRHVITNAIGFTPDSGNIQIKVYTDDISGRREVKIAVEDSGIGIPGDDLDRVYEPFYRAKNATQQGAGGLGLGLTVTSKIIEDHGGTIDLATGRGTVVLLALPP